MARKTKYAIEREQVKQVKQVNTKVAEVSKKERAVTFSIFDPKIQQSVDQYLALHKQYKDIEASLKDLRSVIEPYMEDNNFGELHGRKEEGKIKLESQERPIVTSRYTYYDINQLKQILQPKYKKKCIVEVVDKEAADALSKLGEISDEDLNKCKVSNESKKFRAYHS